MQALLVSGFSEFPSSSRRCILVEGIQVLTRKSVTTVLKRLTKDGVSSDVPFFHCSFHSTMRQVLRYIDIDLWNALELVGFDCLPQVQEVLEKGKKRREEHKEEDENK